MMNMRKSNERGNADHGWLKSRHTFSFAEYYDPKHMGFRTLRVINEDRIDGGTGFGKHPHKDMEIISYVIRGALEHQDTMGNNAVIYPGEVQKMSAGTGVFHSEQNHSPGQGAHFFQIWILPSETGGAPGYGQKSFAKELESQKLVLVTSRQGRNGSLAIKQDADIYISRLKKSDHLEYEIKSGRGIWLQVVAGEVTVNGDLLAVGDATSTEDEKQLRIEATQDSEFLLFDLSE